MFDLKLADKEIIMKITVTKPISNKDVLSNFVGNLLTGAGGDAAQKVNLILTEHYLYLEYKGHAAIGFAEETRDVVQLYLKDIIEFKVELNKMEEMISIKTVNRDYSFIRDNKNDDGLALAMSKIIGDMK